MATSNTADIKQYYVHTVGGEKVPVKASSFEVDEKKQQFIFSGGDSEWVFFWHGVAGIESKHKLAIPGFGRLRIR